jgi:hypothetical protein
MPKLARAAALGCLLLAGCSDFHYERKAGRASDSLHVVQSEAALIAVMGTGLQQNMSPSDAARSAAKAAYASFRPETCLESHVLNRTVVHELKDCGGPWSLEHVTGEVTVEFGRTRRGLTYRLRSTGLQVRGAPMDIDHGGLLERRDNRTRIEAKTRGRATGPRGFALVRDGRYELSWRSAHGPATCLQLAGTWETISPPRGASYETRLRNFRRCKAQCPASGGSMTWTGKRRTLRLDYDASPIAHWKTGRRRAGTVSLFCGPREGAES